MVMYLLLYFYNNYICTPPFCVEEKEKKIFIYFKQCIGKKIIKSLKFKGKLVIFLFFILSKTSFRKNFDNNFKNKEVLFYFKTTIDVIVFVETSRSSVQFTLMFVL